MQAKQVAQYQITDRQSVTNSISFMQNGKSQSESAFALLFSQIQSRDYGNDAGYMSILDGGSYGKYADDWSNFRQNQFGVIENSQTDQTSGNASYADQDRVSAKDVSDDRQADGVSVERPDDRQADDVSGEQPNEGQAGGVSGEQPDDGQADGVSGELSDGESVTSEAHIEQDSKVQNSDDSLSKTHEQRLNETDQGGIDNQGQAQQTEGEKAALMALSEMLQAMLAQRSDWVNQKQTFGLDQGKKRELAAILEGLKGKSDAGEAATSLKNLAEFLKSNQTILKEYAIQGRSNGEGNALADLKKLLSQLDPEARLEMKKGKASKMPDQTEANAKSKEGLSFLESVRSTFQGRKIAAEHTETRADAKNSSAAGTQNSGSGMVIGKTDSFVAEMKAVGGKNASADFIQSTKTGGQGKDIPDNGLSGAAFNMRSVKNGMMSQGTAKAEARQPNQEMTIKNFQEVRALLDKQIVQVKEASTSSMTIKLNPQELGKINIQLELLDNGKLQGKIFVENEITKNNLQQYAEIMKDQIKAQGISLDKFEINLGSGEMEQRFHDFQQQGEHGRQPGQSRGRQSADFNYDEELSNQLKSALQPEAIPVGKLNTLA